MALIGIEKTIQRFLINTCVYWGNPVTDGFGGNTFDDPVEITCRWDEKQETKISSGGNQFTSQSRVMVNQDLDRLGYLYLGTLEDFDSSVDLSKPKAIKDAYAIWQFEKIPFVRANTGYTRNAFLYDEG